MAKGNIFLGTLSGSIGDVTFMRRLGKQVSRARVRTVANPKSVKQRISRETLKCVGRAYTIMAALEDHAFGLAGKARNQSRFQKLNLDTMRVIAANQASGGQDIGNFVAGGADNLLPVNPYNVSEGSLLSVNWDFGLDAAGTENLMRLGSFATSVNINALTYRDVITNLGLQAGDQLTFAFILGSDETGNGQGKFHLARIILMPSDGNLDGNMFTSGTEGYEIANPNPFNMGELIFNMQAIQSGDRKALEIDWVNGNEADATLAGACIVSRMDSAGRYKYSTEQMKLTESAETVTSILDAISQVDTTVIAENDNYLDNAQTLETTDNVITPIRPETPELVSVNLFGSGGAPIGEVITPDADGEYAIPIASTSWFVILTADTSYHITPNSNSLSVTEDATSAFPNHAFGLRFASGVTRAAITFPGVGRFVFKVQA